MQSQPVDIMAMLLEELRDIKQRLMILESQEFTKGGGSGGSSTFTGLTDTPASYSGNTQLVPRVNTAENALYYSRTPRIWPSYTPTTGQVVVWNGSISADQSGGPLSSTLVTTNSTAVVTHAMYQNVATQTLLGRNAGGAGSVSALTDLPTNIDALYPRLAGRSGGQTLRGGTAASNDLTLESTSNATKGNVIIQPNGGGVGINTSNPDGALHILRDEVNTEFYIERGVDGSRFRIAAQNNQTRIGTTNATSFFIMTGGVAGGNTRLIIDASGRVAIGASAPATSAILDIQGTTGALILPRMTTTQRNALTATNGMLVYNTSTDKVQARAGGSWVDLH